MKTIVIDKFEEEKLYDVHLMDEHGEIDTFYTKQGFGSFDEAFVHVQQLVCDFKGQVGAIVTKEYE